MFQILNFSKIERIGALRRSYQNIRGISGFKAQKYITLALQVGIGLADTLAKSKKNKDLDGNQKQPLLETARKWEAIAQLIEKATPLIVKGRKISERKTPLRTLENTGTCAVCGQNVKLNEGGKIVNHGHTVEYHQHNGWCMGQYKFPWEVSPEGAIYYVEKYLLPEKSRIESKLEILVWSPLILSGLERDLRATVGEISTLERRIAKWEKQELPGSLSPTPVPATVKTKKVSTPKRADVQ